MDVAGLLLTGGASRRLGRPKADLPFAETTLARHLAAVVGVVASGPVLELGPGHTDLVAVGDPVPGRGPLAAIAAGAQALGRQGWPGPALVVATDLPGLTVAVLRLVADHPSVGSVVPIDHAGRRQLLCARYAPAELARAVRASAAGERAAWAALEGAEDVVELAPADWGAVGGPGALDDVDEPADLDRAGLW